MLMRALIRRLGCLLAVLPALALSTRTAAAADCDAQLSTCIDSELLWPTAGPRQFISVAGVETLARGRFGFGLVTAMQQGPIAYRTTASSPAGSQSINAVDFQLISTLLFSYGITDQLQVDLATPFTLAQTGTGVSRLTGGSVDLPTTGVRDVRIGAAYAFVPVPRVGEQNGVYFGARFDLSLPSGDKDYFGGDRGVVAVPSLMLDDRIGRFGFSAQLGARLRGTVPVVGGRIGSQLYLAAGASVALDAKKTFALTAESFALPSLISDGPSQVQWLGGVRWNGLLGGDVVIAAAGGGGFRGGERAQILEPEWRALLDLRWEPVARDRDGDGVLDKDDACPTTPRDHGRKDGCPGEDPNALPPPPPDRDHDGVVDDKDRCPDVAGEVALDGCPKPAHEPVYETCVDGSKSGADVPCDVDHDGIADAQDLCPNEPEDFDKVLDDDGCPEKDADEDGVGDQVDKCPLEPETIDGNADDDGCPEPDGKARVTFNAGAIEVVDAATFEKGKFALTKAMKAELPLIAQRLQGLVDRGVKEIVVEGFGDRAGEDAKNKELAQKRADALRVALVGTGIPEALIKAKVGDLVEALPKGRPSYLVTVRLRRKAPLGKPHEVAR
jgi:OOP family OmpA-OmpF porin